MRHLSESVTMIIGCNDGRRKDARGCEGGSGCEVLPTYLELPYKSRRKGLVVEASLLPCG